VLVDLSIGAYPGVPIFLKQVLRPNLSRRNELRHVEVVSRVILVASAAEETEVICAAGGAGAGLVQAGGQATVGEAHVADQALGVVVQ
jgi:hypothetical protein